MRWLLCGIALWGGVAGAEPGVLLVLDDGTPPALGSALQSGLKPKGVSCALAADGSAARGCLQRPSGDRAKCFGEASAAAQSDGVLFVSATELKGRLAVSLQLFASHSGELLEQEAAKGKPAEAAKFLAPAVKTIAAAVKAQATKNKARPPQPPPAPAPVAAPAPPPAAATPAPAGAAAPAPLEPMDTARLKLALYDFKAAGDAQQLANAAKAQVASELQRAGLFKVTTSEALASILALERQKQMMGCSEEDSTCMAEMADALGVDYIVTGTVVRLPDAYSLDLSLLDARKARREGSQVLNAKADSEILAALPQAVVKLIAAVAAKRSGFLALTAKEKGATVKVDDAVRGTTPLDARLTLAGGVHDVSVEKDGFISWQKTVRIGFDQVTEETVSLVPSPDFIRAYESKQKRLRVGAFVSTGLAVAAAIAFAIPKIQIEALNSKETGFQYYKDRLVAGVEVENNIDNRFEAEKLKGAIEGRLTASWIALGVGSAAVVAALVFWILGEDPNRYAQFRALP